MSATRWLSGSWLTAVVLLVPTLGLIVTFLAGWPAAISPDMATTIFEGVTRRFAGHQPPLSGLLWSIPLAILPPPRVIATFYALQVVGYWSVFLLLSYAALRRNAPVAAILTSFAGFLPPLFNFVVMLESNMQVGVSWALAIAIACVRPGAWSLLACLPLIFYGFIARYGLIAAVGPIVFASLTLACPWMRLRRAGFVAALTTAAFGLATLATTAVLPGAPSRDLQLAISRLVDIAGVYQTTGTHCMPASLVPPKTTAETIMSDFDPGRPSDLIWRRSENRFLLPDSPEAFASLRDCWNQTVRRYPKDYIRAKIRFALVFLMVGVEWAPDTNPNYAWNKRLGLSIPSSPFAIAKATYVQQSRTMVVWKGWFWLLLTGGACALAFVFGRPGSIAATAVFVGAFGTLVPHFIAGQAARSRYYFLPYILCVTSLMVLGAGSATRPGRASPE